jgi:RimJ/RimL family protein N-acetyltransferase
MPTLVYLAWVFCRSSAAGESALTCIRRSLAAARAFGFHRVELTVREDNANALAVYKKVGCATEGVQRHAVQVDGVYEDLILMAVLF